MTDLRTRAAALPGEARDGLLRYLLGPLRHRDGGFVALAGAEGRPVPGNALAAELLAQPLFHDADPAPGEAALDLLLAAAAGNAPAEPPPPPVIEQADPRDFRIAFGARELAGDLSRGLVVERLRATGEELARHSGNSCGLAPMLRQVSVDVQQHVREFGIERTAGRVQVWHESAVAARGLRGRATFGRLRYAYELAEGDPALHLEVTFVAARATRRLRLTTAFDQLGGADPAGFRLVELALPGGTVRHEGLPDRRTDLPAAGAARIALRGSGRAIEWEIGDPARLVALRATGQRGGRLHWLQARYGVLWLAAGARVTIAERRLLPGLLGAGAAGPAPGALLNALAQPLLHAAAGALTRPPAEDRLAQLRDAALTVAAALDPAAMDSIDLAAAVLGLDSLARAGLGPGPGRAAAALLTRQQPGGAFAGGPEAAPGLEAQAAALLAAARLALRGDTEAAAPALRQGLAALRLTSVEMPGGVPAEAIVVAGAASAVPSSAPLARLLRALRAAQLAAAANALPLPPAESWRLGLLAGLAGLLLQARIEPIGAALAVRPLLGAGAPGLETQALALLALAPPDAAIAALPA